MKEKQCMQDVQVMHATRLNYLEVHNNSKTNNLNAERRGTEYNNRVHK